MATDAKTGQAIYRGAPRVGLRNVGSYQVSGEPWMSGSNDQALNKVKRYVFPYVTREVTVAKANESNTSLWVHFVSGTGHTFSSAVDEVARDGNSTVFRGLHYFPLVSGSNSITFRAKCKEIYVTTPNVTDGVTVNYRVLADLTNIPTSRMYELTGSGHTDHTAGDLS